MTVRSIVTQPLTIVVLFCFYALSLQAQTVENCNSSRDCYQQGLDHYEKKNYRLAIRYFTLAINKAYPNPEEVHTHRANAKYQAGNYANAVADYTNVIFFNAKNASAYNNRGLAKANMERFESAIEDYDRAIFLEPNYSSAYNNRANAYRSIGHYSNALKDYNAAIRHSPKDPLLYNNRGVVNDDLGNYQAALSDYGKAIELKGDYAEAYNNRAHTHHKLGNLRAAIQDYDEAINLDGAYHHSLRIRGEIQTQLEQVKDFEKEHRKQPKQKVVVVSKPVNRYQGIVKKAVSNSPKSKKAKSRFNVSYLNTNDKKKTAKDKYNNNTTSKKRSKKRAKNADAELIWMYPNPDELIDNIYTSSEPFIEIKLKIIGDEKIIKEDFDVYVNNSSPKFNEVRLHKGRKNSYTFTARLQLEAGDNTVDIRLSKSGKTFQSEALTINYEALKPSLYVLAVGTKTNLRYTSKDAYDFAETYDTQNNVSNALFNRVRTKTVIGETATASNIVGELEQFKIMYETENINANDMIIVHLSSHGFVHRDRFYLQGSDYEAGKIRSTAVDYGDVVGILDEIPCKKLLLIDACHSGAAGKKADSQQILYEIKKLNKTKRGITTIVSSNENEFSYEDKSWENGAFTEGILEALQRGLADINNDKIITINELYRYLNLRVPKLVDYYKSKSQTPQMIDNELGNVAIYVVPSQTAKLMQD